jgi:putative SOS response-associated peptidase YedK
MDFKYILVSSLEVIEKRFNVKQLPGLAEIPKSFAISGGDYSYVIVDPNSVQIFQYGMIPHFALLPLNFTTARSEGIKNKADDPGYNGSKAIFLQHEFMKPIFSQRCVIVADAFYEWSDTNQPYLVYLQNKISPIGFAGIYDTWQNPVTREVITSFAIITTTANDMLQKFGAKRMPVILPPQYETNWLKSTMHLSEILRYLVRFPSEKMNAYPVSDSVTLGEVDDASLVMPIGERLQVEDTPMPAVRRYHYHKSKPTSSTPWFRSDKNE